jgi:hypothetical protein
VLKFIGVKCQTVIGPRLAVIEPCDDNRILVLRPGVCDPPSPHEPGPISQRLRFDDGARTDVSRAAVSRSIAGL